MDTHKSTKDRVKQSKDKTICMHTECEKGKQMMKNSPLFAAAAGGSRKITKRKQKSKSEQCYQNLRLKNS